MAERGLVHVYTGSGKGKTSAALGLALRAMGHGQRVAVFQFAKPPDGPSGEIALGKRLKHLEIFRFPNQYPTYGPLSDQERKEMRASTQEALDQAAEAAGGGKYDVVILDEINPLIRQKLANLRRILQLIRGRADGCEIVLTGRDAPAELIAVADYVTEFIEVKHPFQKGTPARKGIEF